MFAFFKKMLRKPTRNNHQDQNMELPSITKGKTLKPIGARIVKFHRIIDDVIVSSAISDDGNMIAFGTLKGHTYTGSKYLDHLSPLSGRHNSIVSDIGIFRNQHLLTTSRDHSLKLWHGSDTDKTIAYKSKSEILSCAISPNQRFFVIGHAQEPYSLDIWSLKSREIAFSLYGHQNAVSSCDISSDSTILVSTAYDGITKVWDLRNQVMKYDVLSHNRNLPARCGISPTMSHFFVSSWDNSLQVRKLDTGDVVWKRDMGYVIGDSSISRDGRYIASVISSQFGIIDAQTGTDIFVGDIPNLTLSMSNHPFVTFRIMFYPENDLLLLVGGCIDADEDLYEGALIVIKLENELS